MIKAVVFDLDDTLIAERQYMESGYRHLAKHLEHLLDEDEEVLFGTMLQLWADSPAGVFNRLLEQYRFPYTEADIAFLVRRYREHEPELHLFEDVLPCLASLKRRGIKTGVLTDGYAVSQRQKLRAVGGDGHFDEIVVTDELGRAFWKPHPEPFRLIRERLGVEYHEMAYVGDNPQKDFHIGRAHPIFTVRIDRGGVYSGRPYLEDVKECASVLHLGELDELLQVI